MVHPNLLPSHNVLQQGDTGGVNDKKGEETWCLKMTIYLSTKAIDDLNV